MASREAWEEMTRRLLAKSVSLFEAADPAVTELGQRDPTIVGLALLARTSNAGAAVLLLLDNNYVVEARIITRSVLENLMFAAALSKKGSAFVNDLLADDVHNRQVRANALAAFFGRIGDHPDKKAELEGFRQRLIDEHGRPDGIKMFSAAEAGEVGDAYIAYRELSTDSAHPSATSISRHIIVPEEPEAPFSLSGPPVIDETEASDTLSLLCLGLIGIVVAVNTVLGGVDAGESIEDLYRDYQSTGRPPEGV